MNHSTASRHNPERHASPTAQDVVDNFMNRVKVPEFVVTCMSNHMEEKVAEKREQSDPGLHVVDPKKGEIVVVMKRVVSNMAGVVLEFLVQPGEAIEIDQDVVMLESMKMQIPVQSTVSGTVTTFKVNEGDFVDDGDVLLEVE